MAWFFGKNKKTAGADKVSRFRTAHYQERIRAARSFHRSPKIAPDARTDISLGGFSRRAFFAVTFTAILIGSVAIWFFFSGFFEVKSVFVEGNDQIPSEAIERWIVENSRSRFAFMVPGNHIILLNPYRVSQILSAQTTKIVSVNKIDRLWPKGLRVTVEERRPVAIWETSGEYYFVGQDGIVSERVPPEYATSTATYVLIQDSSGKSVSENSPVAGKSFFEFTLALDDEWSHRLPSPLKKVSITSASALESAARSEAGWTIFLDNRVDARQQVKNAQMVLEKEVRLERIGGLMYLDLRVPGVAYYCFKDAPCAWASTQEAPPDPSVEQ